MPISVTVLKHVVAVLIATEHLVTSQKCQVLFTPDVAYYKLPWENRKLSFNLLSFD